MPGPAQPVPSAVTQQQTGSTGLVGGSGNFSFSIEPDARGTFALCLHVKEGGLDAMARVGSWPTSAEAEQMAERIAGRLLPGANARWRAAAVRPARSG